MSAPSTGPSTPLWLSVLTGRRIGRVIVALLFGLIALTAVDLAQPRSADDTAHLKDYTAFYVTGQLLLEDRLSDAYSLQRTFEAQARILGARHVMAWTYPPHVTPVTALMAMLPLWLGYAVFSTLGLTAYLVVLRRLAGPQDVLVLLALFPAMAVCIGTGQNGLVTGALLGLFADLALRGRAMAALALALVTYKPHFLMGPGLFLLLGRAWRLIGLSVLACAGLILAATPVIGLSIWADFLSAVGEAGAALKAGLYPMYRMTSLYAALFTLGAGATLAMALQVGLAVSAIAALASLKARNLPARLHLGLCLLATLIFSPYSYDYDLPILGIGLALLMPELLRGADGRMAAALVLLAWIAGGSGLAFTVLGGATGLAQAALPSFGGLALLTLLGVLAVLLRRGHGAGAAGARTGSQQGDGGW